MRLTVISDSHKKSGAIDRILRHTDSKEIFFLGDVVGDIDDFVFEYPERNFHIVRGNCDGFCSYPDYDMVKLGAHNILFTHGHNFSVKRGTDRLFEFAKNTGCDIALYGHTHTAKIDYRDGIYLINPGSCSQSRDGADSYAVIDILKEGVLPAIIKI